jgi:hypothetical protein
MRPRAERSREPAMGRGSLKREGGGSRSDRCSRKPGIHLDCVVPEHLDVIQRVSVEALPDQAELLEHVVGHGDEAATDPGRRGAC